MKKRRFRPSKVPQRQDPSYPTLESFDRRRFLARLGGTLLGAGAVASGLAACGDRAVQADTSVGPMGEPQQPDAGIDTLKPDAELLLPPEGGVAPMPPSQKDAGPEWGVDGDVAQPDAQIDSNQGWAGGKPGPPAKFDGG